MTDAEPPRIRNKIVEAIGTGSPARSCEDKSCSLNMENSAAAILAAAIFIGRDL